MGKKVSEKDEILMEIDPERYQEERADKKKRQKKAERETKKYIKSVRKFLSEKNGGVIPAEWEMSLTMLEVYYKQWLLITYTIQDNGEYTTISGTGALIEHPLVNSQNKAATRLEKYMQELGLSLKSGAKLNIVEPKKKETALDKFLNKQVEKR